MYVYILTRLGNTINIINNIPNTGCLLHKKWPIIHNATMAKSPININQHTATIIVQDENIATIIYHIKIILFSNISYIVFFVLLFMAVTLAVFPKNSYKKGAGQALERLTGGHGASC